MTEEQSRAWVEVVELMRRDPRELGREAQHAPRFLARFSGSMAALEAQFRRAWGLNGHEMQAIVILWEFGRMTMTDLGRRIPLSRAAVTTLTDRLEQEQLVRRIPDPTDRRRIQLEITDRVEAESARIQADWNGRLTSYVEGLDPAVWAQVVDVMADLRDLARSEADELRSLDSDTLRAIGTAGAASGAAGDTREDAPPTHW
jgi:DNA-binding MarR family transcriptional regulator